MEVPKVSGVTARRNSGYIVRYTSSANTIYQEIPSGGRKPDTAMHIYSTLIGFACYGTGLMAWRHLYPGPETALLGLAALGILVALAMVGSFRLSIQRRRAFLSAAIEDGSWLRYVLSGRVAALVTSTLSGLLITPAAAYHALMAEQEEILLMLSLGGIVAALFLAINLGVERHVRPLYRASLAAPFVIGIASAIFMVTHVVFTYAIIPLPDYLDAPGGFTGIVEAASTDLPRHHPMVSEVLSAFSAIEAAGYWLFTRGDPSPGVPLAFFLVQGALIHVSLAKIAVDLQAAFYASASTNYVLEPLSDH